MWNTIPICGGEKKIKIIEERQILNFDGRYFIYSPIAIFLQFFYLGQKCCFCKILSQFDKNLN